MLRSEELTATVTTLHLMPESQWVLAATADNQVRAWDGEGNLRLEVESASVLSQARFTTQGLLTAGADGTARLWTVAPPG